MDVRRRGVVLSILLSCALVVSVPAVGQLSARLVEGPQPVGVSVRIDEFAFEGNALTSLRLTVANESANLLTIDTARSSFVSPDGEVRPLMAFLGSDFRAILLPGESTSGVLDALGVVQVGDEFRLGIVWTLGALVEAGAWTWRIVDASVPQVAALPDSAAGAETPSGADATAGSDAPDAGVSADVDGNGDYVLGLAGLALGLVLVALLGWGLWSLGSLLW